MNDKDILQKIIESIEQDKRLTDEQVNFFNNITEFEKEQSGINNVLLKYVEREKQKQKEFHENWKYKYGDPLKDIISSAYHPNYDYVKEIIKLININNQKLHSISNLLKEIKYVCFYLKSINWLLFFIAVILLYKL
jgi:hypothetical protein